MFKINSINQPLLFTFGKISEYRERNLLSSKIYVKHKYNSNLLS